MFNNFVHGMEYFSKLINRLSRLSASSVIVISAVCLIIIGLVDEFIDIELSVSILYLIPIAIASWFTKKWAGIIFAFAGTMVWLVDDLLTSRSIWHPLFSYWNAIIMLGIFILFALLLSELKKIITNERTLALDVQKSLLPQNTPEVNTFIIRVIWEPTRVVSGDYYDFIEMDHSSFGVCLADVTGHGYPAALLMSNLQAVFRNLANRHNSPHTVAAELNQIIFNSIIPEKFTTFFYGILNAEKMEIYYSNAGHPPPLIIRKEKIYRLSTGGLLLGFSNNSVYEETSFPLESGDIILFYTDGILEARDPKGEEFGEKRFIDFCRDNIKLPEAEFRKLILETLDKFTHSIMDDDITLVLVTVT